MSVYIMRLSTIWRHMRARDTDVNFALIYVVYVETCTRRHVYLNPLSTYDDFPVLYYAGSFFVPNFISIIFSDEKEFHTKKFYLT